MRTALSTASSRDSSTTDHPSVAHDAGRRMAPPRYGVDLVDQRGSAARLQSKARIGAAGDPLEHEADRLADVVMSGGFAGPVSRATPHAAAAAHAVSGGGAPLPAPARAFFGARFGRDFSDVRIH